MKLSDIEKLNAAIAARRPMALATWIASGRQELLPHPDQATASAATAMPDELADVLRDRFRTDRSGTNEIAGEEVFVRVYNPALQMIIIGAVHIAQALIPMAKALGYAPVVIDPRTAFNSEERFADVPRDTRWPDEALADLTVDARTAFIALTHDPKIDDPALKIALAAAPFYIGALGSRRTHASRVERLAAQGISEQSLARIRAPIGLDIGAVGAPEIAVSIIAEVTAALRGRTAK
jgi:xanthine dehydrogenase accessory factor